MVSSSCCITLFKGLVGTTLLSSLLCLYEILKSAEFSSSYARSYADAVGYKGPELVAKLQIMPRGGDEVPKTPLWDIPDVVVHDDANEFLKSKNTRYIASNYSFSPGQGNIMFQYASLRALALKYNATLLVPEGILIRRSFKLNATFVSMAVLKNLLEAWKPRLVYGDCCRYYKETEKLNFTKPRAVMGYFQSFKYFHPDFSSRIRQEFTFLPRIRQQAQEYLTNALQSVQRTMDNVTFVAVHVRRGLDMTWNMRNMEHGHKGSFINDVIEFESRLASSFF